MKLLYLEDDTSFARRFHSELLAYRAVQWNLLHCRYLSEALERLSQDSYDAVLCDITNGDNSDTGLCNRLVTTVDVPVVAYGNNDDPQLARNCLSLGVQDYLDKYAITAPQAMLRIRMAMERYARYCRQPPLLTEWDAAARRAGHKKKATGRDRQAGDSESLEKDDVGGAATATLTRPRWLIIDEDEDLASGLRHTLGGSVEVEQILGMDDLKEVERAGLQAVILDTSEGSKRGLEALAEVLSHCGQLPIIVVSVHDDESTAIQSIKRGAEDYLVKSQLTPARLATTLELARIRRRRVAEEYQDRMKLGVIDRRKVARGRDRRIAARYLLTRPVVMIPMLPNGCPDESGQTEAVTVDISTTGMSMLIRATDRLPSRHWVVGIESQEGDIHYITAELRHSVATAEGQRLGVRFLHGDRDLLSDENLFPRLDPRTHRLEAKLDGIALQRWESLGVLTRRAWNRVKACPDCHAVVATSTGCRDCGSPFLIPTEMIHHFACAYIGHAGDFEQHGELVCPKCRTRSLVVGADYEILDGPYRCQECDFQGTERVTVANCLSCHVRYPLERAEDLEIVAYHVDRLDTLAFIDSTR